MNSRRTLGELPIPEPFEEPDTWKGPRKVRRGLRRDGAEDAIIPGGMEDTDPQGVGRKLRKGLGIYVRDDVKVRMHRRGRARKPPTREEYNRADRFIGTMVGLLPGDPEGEIQ